MSLTYASSFPKYYFISLVLYLISRLRYYVITSSIFFFFQAEDGIRDYKVTGVQTCALPIEFRLCFFHLFLHALQLLHHATLPAHRGAFVKSFSHKNTSLFDHRYLRFDTGSETIVLNTILNPAYPQSRHHVGWRLPPCHLAPHLAESCLLRLSLYNARSHPRQIRL